MGKKKKFIKLIYLLFGSNIFGGGSAIAALKEIVLAIPFNKEYEFCEDYDWWIKILLAEVQIEYLPISLVKYRVHNKNMTSNYLKILDYNFQIFKKIIYKSLILFLTSFFGLLRTFLSVSIKSTKIIWLKFMKK
jgi:hypothetical protein